MHSDQTRLTPESRYAALVQELVGTAEASQSGKGFGSTGLKVDGKIFAMLVRGKLVVKLPRSRAAALVEAGEGEHYDANKGRPMNEWLVLAPAAKQDWLLLAREAMRFVAAR